MSDPTEWLHSETARAIHLLRRFLNEADEDALQSAIAIFRAVVDGCPADRHERPTFLSHLGSALQHRYQHQGHPPDLDEAVARLREAVRGAEYHRDRHRYLNNLGGALAILFRRDDDETILDEALRILREAVELTPATTPNWPPG